MRRDRRTVARLVVALLVVVGAATPASAARGAATDLCAALDAALQAVQLRIDQHNAAPHQFTIPDQAAAAAAYDAEAAQLNAEQESAATNLETCLEAASALGDVDNTSLDVNPPDEQVRQVLQNAKDKIPNGWVPPPSPAVGKNWRVPKGTPPRDLYDALRAGNPPRLGADDVLRGQARPAVGAKDPAYSGLDIGQAAGGRSAVSGDHIIPIAEQINMPGFVQLTPDNMYVVTRAPLNFQWLSFKANLSKQSRSVAGMSGVDPRWQAEQVEVEAEVRASLQAAIDRLLRSQGVTPPGGG